MNFLPKLGVLVLVLISINCQISVDFATREALIDVWTTKIAGRIDNFVATRKGQIEIEIFNPERPRRVPVTKIVATNGGTYFEYEDFVFIVGFRVVYERGQSTEYSFTSERKSDAILNLGVKLIEGELLWRRDSSNSLFSGRVLLNKLKYWEINNAYVEYRKGKETFLSYVQLRKITTLPSSGIWLMEFKEYLPSRYPSLDLINVVLKANGKTIKDPMTYNLIRGGVIETSDFIETSLDS